MDKKQLSITWVIGLIIILFISGCTIVSQQDKAKENDSKKVRVSGDVTVSAGSREGF